MMSAFVKIPLQLLIDDRRVLVFVYYCSGAADALQPRPTQVASSAQAPAYAPLQRDSTPRSRRAKSGVAIRPRRVPRERCA